MVTKTLLILVVLLTALLIGCSGEGERVAQVATQAADRQASQNEQMAKLQREVAAGSRLLVEQQSELTGVSRELQAERNQLMRGWGELHTQRREIARDRRTTSTLTDIFRGGSAVFVALVALAFCWLLLGASQGEPEIEATLCDFLLRRLELTREPTLLHQEAPHRKIPEDGSSASASGA